MMLFHVRVVNRRLSPQQFLQLQCSVCNPKACVVVAGAQEPFGRSRTKTCQVCGKVYDNMTHLKRHMSVHTGERPFSCSVCGRCFSRRDHLTRHHISHTGMKPYSCSLCPSAFTSNQSLKRHMDSHQQPEARPLIYCSMD
uniref:C2H2-type domain-containing protein n=1 Tax=Knipowitschia caucasica TaxID=637954 RepID=A0AAV2K8J2_KNICA